MVAIQTNKTISNMTAITTAYVCFILSLAVKCGAFSTGPTSQRLTGLAPLHSTPAEVTSSSINDASAAAVVDATNNQFTPVFDFTLDDVATKQQSAASFERIDDAIMGGISLSSLRDVPDKDYASWSGVCRTDGGGFCGMRTLPFKDAPLNATGQEGVYLDCNLASDDEAERRIWKLTVRTDSSRGEMVYQSQFDLKQAIEDAKKQSVGDEKNDVSDAWAKVLVPFDKFQLVRGPRLIPDGPPLNVTGGIYQIGMTLSKFVMNVNTTELENFRPGYFDLRIKRIGFYNSQHHDGGSNVSASTKVAAVPTTLSKEDAEKKRPVVLRLLLPIAKLLFSEQANRRRSAMRILREERKLSRARAIIWGIKCRKESMGMFKSCAKTAGILSVDILRSVIKTTLKIVLLYPIRLIGATIRAMKKAMGMKVKPSLRE
ncbi:complex I intermediate-associated protein 30 [Skeletonema marinoi]|uniref:Complex I intermediate-associated protein 30 n=1 Tax=Skeletonema marinoi TaxID=267567 RepID=A0AAD8YPK1_9STRA|nr:complex I intermediate-associated protein 30 [Skeletonema marinoi]